MSDHAMFQLVSRQPFIEEASVSSQASQGFLAHKIILGLPCLQAPQNSPVGNKLHTLRLPQTLYS